MRNKWLLSFAIYVALFIFHPETSKAQNLTLEKLSSSPCSLILNPVQSAPNAHGVALWTLVTRPYDMEPKATNPPLRSRIAFGIYGDWLPSPSSFGNFDQYEGFAQVPGKISWRFKMTQVKCHESWFGGETWVGKFDEISLSSLPADTLVQVRLTNSKTDQFGPVVLENTLKDCH